MNTTTRHKITSLALGLTMLVPVGAVTLGSAETASAEPYVAKVKTHKSSKPTPAQKRVKAILRERKQRGQVSRGGGRAQNATQAPVSVRALGAARTRAGSPYVYGASGPEAFDCSGLTSWAYAQVGKTLPRSSDAQAAATVRVASPAVGDLVFFHSGGDVYHVGLYAGDGQVFHSSRPGTPVGQAKIWTSSVFFGRVR